MQRAVDGDVDGDGLVLAALTVQRSEACCTATATATVAIAITVTATVTATVTVVRVGSVELRVNRDSFYDRHPRMDDDVSDVNQVAGFFGQIFGQKVQ